MESQTFKNNTLFYIPIWTNQYDEFISWISTNKYYQKSNNKEELQYMLPYITNIYIDEELFVEYDLKKEYFPDLHMFNKEKQATLTKVVVSCFSTGCLFLELKIEYDGLTLEEIANFSFQFKNATKTDKEKTKPSLINAIKSILPNNLVKPFFTSSSIKQECKMFHQLFVNNDVTHKNIKSNIFYLSRGYYTDMPIPNVDDEYDMSFEPFDYDHWAGSQEGLVNIFHLPQGQKFNYFIEQIKPIHLSVYYRFMYLILLNQRYSTIKYLEQIPMIRTLPRKDREEFNVKMSTIKTVFAFSIVSDDLLYQTIYSKMYHVLSIDTLLKDMKDNEEQIELLQNQEILKAENQSSFILFGLSLLSIFSVLIDAAQYFDRIPFISYIPTISSTIVVCIIVIFIFFFWHRSQSK